MTLLPMVMFWKMVMETSYIVPPSQSHISTQSCDVTDEDPKQSNTKTVVVVVSHSETTMTTQLMTCSKVLSVLMNEIAQKSQEGFPIAGEHQIYLKYWRRNKQSRFSNHWSDLWPLGVRCCSGIKQTLLFRGGNKRGSDRSLGHHSTFIRILSWYCIRSAVRF